MTNGDDKQLYDSTRFSSNIFLLFFCSCFSCSFRLFCLYFFFGSKMTFAKPRATYKCITQLPAIPSRGEPQTTHNKFEELSEAQQKSKKKKTKKWPSQIDLARMRVCVCVSVCEPKTEPG